MGKYSEAKSARVLAIYARLLSGQTLRRTMLAQEYGVTERSILRDVEALRSFLSDQELPSAGGVLPGALPGTVRGGGVPQAGAVHVWRETGADSIPVHRAVPGSGAGPSAYGRGGGAGRERLDPFGGDFRKGD